MVGIQSIEPGRACALPLCPSKPAQQNVLDVVLCFGSRADRGALGVAVFTTLSSSRADECCCS